MTVASIPVKCTVSTTDPGAALAITVLLDGNTVYHCDHVVDVQNIEFSVPDDDSVEHVIEWRLSGKIPAHTQIDQQGNIVSDALMHIKDICIDNLNIDQICFENAVYTHNFNGNGNTVNDKFYGTIGCNGTVQLTFVSPFYVWLLEHM